MFTRGISLPSTLVTVMAIASGCSSFSATINKIEDAGPADWGTSATSTATDTTGGSRSGSGGTLTTGGTVLGVSTATAGGSTTTSTGGSGSPASGGTPTTGGAASTGGSAVTGGAVPTGGTSAVATTSCSNTSTTIGTPGTCCVQSGAYGCSTNASPHKVICVNGLWTANNDCPSGQLCDTRLSTTAGSCQTVVTECAGKSPGDAVCNGQIAESCGPDLVSVSTVKTCTNQACVSGSCQGSCTPSQKQCDSGGSNATQTCDSSGNWEPLTGCPGTTPVCNAGACVACPGTGGPAMVGLPLNYCIDSTEVTQGQYQAWLDTSPQPSNQISVCSWNQDFTPGGTWPPASSALNLPVIGINWCEAYAYCKSVGKRLCGKIGGGSNGYSDYANPSQSQWYAACTSNDTCAYPYGNSYQSSHCSGADAALDVMPVAALAQCQSTVSGYAGVYDLSGNVWEWEDSCDGVTGASDRCHIRGGASYSDSTGLECDYNANIARGSIGLAFPDAGIRCCWP